MSDGLQVALFVLVVLAIVVVPFFVWKIRSKKGGKPYDEDWEEKARSRTGGADFSGP